MVFRMNVGGGECWLRIGGGILMIALGLFVLKGTLIGYLIDAAGVAAVVTGAVRWCPMCAVLGRRLPE